MRGKMEWQREISGFSKGEGCPASMEKGKGGLQLVCERDEENKVYFLRFLLALFCFTPASKFFSLPSFL